MNVSPTPITPELYQYIIEHSPAEHPALVACREYTAAQVGAHLQIAIDIGHFLVFMVRLLQAQRILEIGTFTGYSSLAMALAQAEGGQIITCDVNPHVQAQAQRFWQQAGVAERITAKAGPALATLQALAPDQRFDLAFIDANKAEYRAYFDTIWPLMRPGGVIVIDNVLMGGAVIDADNQRRATQAVREFNQYLAERQLTFTLLGIADGLSVVHVPA